jgi:hypothetical protein
MRPRPQWRKPYRCYPKGAGPGIHAALVAKRTAFGDFSLGSGRRQCVSIAKGSGERCKRDAVQGAARCKTHKGIAPAIRNLRRERGACVQRASKGVFARRALCAIAFGPTPNPDLSSKRGPTSLGRLYEAYQNRAYAPDFYKELLLICQNQTSEN